MRTLFIVSVAWILVACGGESELPDLAAFRQIGQEISGAVESHRSGSQTLGVDACVTERSRYEAELGPMLDRMQAQSSVMDACMEGMGHMGKSDMESTCISMRGELDSHLASACAADSIADEANRHGMAMTDMIVHEMSRADDMAGMEGTHMMDGHCSR